MPFEYVVELNKAHLIYLVSHKARIAPGRATGVASSNLEGLV